jgi:S-DNA-T family DNA segregation ATPase FtsK/SpoIIIE
MFEEVHGAAEWVATYDDLLDKRQLSDLGIRVIRYRRQRTHGRNMIVSSTTELQLLKVLLRRRLTELSLGLGDDALGALVDKMISDAIAISGDVVLRAAKRGVSAGELIGLVLSRAIIAEEIGAGATVAWFLLDDYAQWLGQKEEGIADILALSVSRDAEGRPRLKAIVSEAKYVGAPACSDARRTSQQQLRQTMLRMEDALFGDPGRLDRDMWLSRIADLLLDGVTAVGESAMLENVRDGIRQGTVTIDFRGYSHVFVSGPAGGGGIVSEQQPVADLEAGVQEVFGLETVCSLLKAYAAGTPLLPIRSGVGELRPWEQASYRTPSPRVIWTVAVGPEEADGTTGSTIPVAGTGDGSAQVGSPRTGTSATPAGGTDDQTATTQSAASGGLERLIAERGGHRGGGSAEDAEWLAATERKLRSALTSYGLQAKALSSRLTPNAGLIRFQGSDRLRVEDIEGRASALLTTHGLKLVAVSPMPGEIVIAVARPSRQVVSLWEVWRRRELNRNAAGLNTSFVLGLRELDGEVLYLNLGSAFGGGQQHEPHTLIAGATGSGKSVLIQSILLDIAATNPPQLAQIYLIDPKMGVDYGAIERLPHVEGGIVVERDRAVEVMEGLIGEMERRYEAFRTSGVRDLRGYNSKVDVAQRLPMIFLVHDEFAE